MNEQIAGYDKQIEEVKKKIDVAMAARSGEQDELSKERAKRDTIKAELDKLKGEKDALSSEFDRLKGKLDSAMDASKSAKSQMKFRTVEEINAEMARLNKLQSTTSMVLSEEKKLVKELESLRAQKRQLSALGASEGLIKNDKEERARLQASLKAKRDEVNECFGRLTAQREVCDKTQAKENGGEGGKKGLVPTLHDQRNAIWKKKSEAITQIKALREQVKEKWEEFKGARKEWEAHMEEERKVREAERKARQEEWERKMEEEEAKKVPYEEEMALCDYLVNYLKQNFLTEKEEPVVAAAGPTTPAAAFEHEGMTLQAFRREDEEEEQWAGGKKKKEKKQGGEGGRKGKGGGKKDTLAHSPELLASFALLKLDAPSKATGVEAAVVALKEKKEWYSVQPRPEKKKAAKTEEGAGAEGEEAVKEEGGAGDAGANRGKGGRGEGGKGKGKGEKKQPKEFKRSEDDFPSLGAAMAAPAVARA